jgi:hypothetical protein
MDTELIELYYKMGIYSLASGVPSDIVIEMMEDYAEEDRFEMAEGYKRALIQFLSKGSQNSRLKLFTDY